MLHSFVGLAAVLVGIATLHAARRRARGRPRAGAPRSRSSSASSSARSPSPARSSRSLKLRGTHRRQAAAAARAPPAEPRDAASRCVVLLGECRARRRAGRATGLLALLAMTGARAACSACTSSMAIGGADMPVVVSMLNSYSGWAAAAAGFMLVERPADHHRRARRRSGAILCYIMCRAMNRSIWNVIFGGFGAEAAQAGAGAAAAGGRGARDQRRRGRRAAARGAPRTSIIVPGYGMAVAQAQHAVREITDAAARAGRQRALRDPPGRRAPARPHERAARRGQRPLRHRQGDGRDQRRTSPRPTSCS